ncbi:MAG: bifunctional phosphopantothenoylcysteine decarboxylase/phosphopantothenate--cysteine ligase CoaBC [Candidatus Symbiobacter sp.]|nr:bifunctional phosphopantothenoylcysteine decarboxylase/phosphopantothenate--cysteine ligase CoaBC [Candidatus Symbiobacter sp.]
MAEKIPSPDAGRGKILLMVGGGIAAVKIPELIRRLRDAGFELQIILTKAGRQFVTPLSLSSLAGQKIYENLFSLTDEAEMGHIRLSRESDLILVAPATADMMAKMAVGLADDLASTCLLAANKPIALAPSMNSQMWLHPATQANLATLRGRGVAVIAPGSGDLACGEVGVGRMAEVPDIVAFCQTILAGGDKPLRGKRALVTSGPTVEKIDPVRFISNRSSGKQGHAIAAALVAAGAEVTLVTGPVALPPPPGAIVIPIESAAEMLAACEAVLQRSAIDIGVYVAAVSDWRVAEIFSAKIKKEKSAGGTVVPPQLRLEETPDILAHVGQHRQRPHLLIGFAAETENLIANAAAKRTRKNCDWIVANQVGGAGDAVDDRVGGVFGRDHNQIHLVKASGHDAWPVMSKTAVAARLVAEIVRFFRG